MSLKVRRAPTCDDQRPLTRAISLIGWLAQRCSLLIACLAQLSACDYRWGARSAERGLGATHHTLLAGEGRFEVSHDGAEVLGRAELLSELLWAYQRSGGEGDALHALTLRLALTRRPLSSGYASFDGKLSVWAHPAQGARLTTLEATVIRPSVVSPKAISGPEGEATVALCASLGAQLAVFTRAGDI